MFCGLYILLWFSALRIRSPSTLVTLPSIAKEKEPLGFPLAFNNIPCVNITQYGSTVYIGIAMVYPH